MSKLLEASCVAGVVTVDGVPVPAADILSEGVGQSEGVLILDEDNAKYLAKTSPDLDSTLAQLIEGLNQAVTAFNQAVIALTAIDAAAAAKLPPSAPVATASIAQITSASASITAATVQLQTLKGMLK